MTSVHQIAGRLRLKFPQLKNRTQLAGAIEMSIRSLPTVRLAHANTITGSLLIHYDARGAQQVILLKTIQDVLHRQFGLAISSDIPAKPAANSMRFHGNPIADRVADMIIEKIIERSALALLGVLI